MIKLCIKCVEEKPDFEFTTSSQTKDGLHAYCNSCRTKLNAITHMKTFILLVKEYGNKCSCCGETELEFLTIEHINKDAKQHRADIKNLYATGTHVNRYQMCLDIKKQGYPKDKYTILCFNCNCSTSSRKVCVHKRESVYNVVKDKL